MTAAALFARGCAQLIQPGPVEALTQPPPTTLLLIGCLVWTLVVILLLRPTWTVGR